MTLKACTKRRNVPPRARSCPFRRTLAIALPSSARTTTQTRREAEDALTNVDAFIAFLARAMVAAISLLEKNKGRSDGYLCRSQVSALTKRRGECVLVDFSGKRRRRTTGRGEEQRAVAKRRAQQQLSNAPLLTTALAPSPTYHQRYSDSTLITTLTRIAFHQEVLNVVCRLRFSLARRRSTKAEQPQQHTAPLSTPPLLRRPPISRVRAPNTNTQKPAMLHASSQLGAARVSFQEEELCSCSLVFIDASSHTDQNHAAQCGAPMLTVPICCWRDRAAGVLGVERERETESRSLAPQKSPFSIAHQNAKIRRPRPPCRLRHPTGPLFTYL